MKKNKFLWILGILLFISFISISILLYKNAILNAQLIASEHSTNFLLLHRNLETFKSLDEKNWENIQKNLDLYLSIELKPIELHGINKHLNIKDSKRLLCHKYRNIWRKFIEYNKNKYPLASNDLIQMCK